MEDDDGYMNLDLSRREGHQGPPCQETKDPSSSANLLRWKISLGVALLGIVALTIAVIVLSLSSFRGSSGMMEMDLPHPVLVPADLYVSKNCSMLEPFYKIPKHNSCIPTDYASCLPNSEVCISLPKSIAAAVNQMALIPVDVDVPNSDWSFIQIQWHHTQGTQSDFILKFELRSCALRSNLQQWWQRECHVFVEVMPAHRWKTSVTMNAWLVLWNVQAKDAGRYQVTVRSDNMKDACSFVELSVTEGDGEKRNPLSVLTTAVVT